MPMIEVRDVQIYFELHGSGPPLVIITGTGNDLRNSAPSRSPLNQHFTVLHYDQRGLGQSSPGEGGPTIEDFADDAAALIGAMGWEPCPVVGTSFGGMVAQNLVVRHPNMVSRLVLNCTSPGGSRPSYPLHELHELSTEARVEATFGLWDERYDPEAADPIPGLGSMYRLIRDRMLSGPPPGTTFGLRQQLEARRHHNVEALLETVTVKTLVCAGRYDRVAPVANSRAIVDRLQNASLQEFDGGHLFMLQDKTVFPTIVEFLLETE